MERAITKLIELGYGEHKVNYKFQNRSKQQLEDERLEITKANQQEEYGNTDFFD